MKACYGLQKQAKMSLFLWGFLLIWFSGVLVSPWVGYFYIHNRGVENPFHDYVVGLAVAVLFTGIVYGIACGISNGRQFLLTWLMGMGMALLVMLPYERYYATLDAYTYYEKAHFSSEFWENQYSIVYATANVTRFTTLLRFLFPSYRALVVVFAFLGALGRFLFFTSVQRLLPSRVNELLLAWPSLVFWTSILGKDPLTILGSGLVFWGVVKYINTRTVSRHLLCVMIGGFLVLLLFRFYLAVILGVTLILGVIVLQLRKLLPYVMVALLLGVWGLVAYWGPRVLMIQVFLNDLLRYSRSFAYGGAGQHVPWNTIFEYLLWLPWVVFSVWFRPLPFETPSPFGFVISIENVILLLFSGFAFLVSLYRGKLKRFEIFLLLFLAIWSSVMGLAIYQNLGTASRVRSAQALPFLLALIALSLGRVHWRARSDVRHRRLLAIQRKAGS